MIDAAGHGALALSLLLPLGAGTDLAFAGIDLGEAREELEWARPDLAATAPARLGPLHVADDVDAARDVVARLVAVAIDRVDALGVDHTDASDLSILGRVMRKLQSANEEFARAVA